ncbi:MAG: methylmalonyl-CoA/ethylmalonyl-CoA epimerase [Mycobacterium sp.]|nr:methylmalonyl-CoA/ethylmalonyl-CoA epimerase [Mycobacterium sp.]
MSPVTAKNPHDKTTVSEVAGDVAPMLIEIDHVAIAVRDLGAAIDYYRETFGALVEHREVVESDGVEEA